MKLIRYARPETDVFGKRFSDIMDEFFSEVAGTYHGTFTPSIDVSETEKQIEIDVFLPGLRKEDIAVSLENGLLTVTGERKQSKEEKGRKFHKIENAYGRFERTLQLPEHLDQDSVKATFKDGILSITVDKVAERLRKEIKIS
jgi:HSP20 family protein